MFKKKFFENFFYHFHPFFSSLMMIPMWSHFFFLDLILIFVSSKLPFRFWVTWFVHQCCFSRWKFFGCCFSFEIQNFFRLWFIWFNQNFFWWFWNDDDRYQRVSQYNQSISIIDSINRYLSITKQNIKIVINLFLPTFWQTNLFFLLNQHSFSNDYFLKYRYYRDIDIECSFDYVSNLFLENKQTNNKIFQKLMMLSLLFFF